MHTLHGIAVSPGIAVGEALVLDNEGQRVPCRHIADHLVDQELSRFQTAWQAAVDEMEQRRAAVTAELGPQYGAIFSAHLQMIRDPALVTGIQDQVRGQRVSAEFAVHHNLRRYAQIIERMGNGYMAERALDIYDIERLLLEQLVGRRRNELVEHDGPYILVAHRLTPAETANLDRERVLGFVTETGGAGGHTAIVAEAMEIPAIVGAPSCLTQIVSGTRIIIDGDHGTIIVDPDEETLENYRKLGLQRDQHLARLMPLGEMPAETTDGVRVYIMANIEFPQEVHACLTRGADGVGLYRTEFLYLKGNGNPDEQQQYEAYREVARAMADRPVIIRTVDLGADKLIEDPFRDPEPNPFLGLRSIRVSLRDAAAFRTQLRAILRASAEGQLKLMFPLVSTLNQLLEARAIVRDVMEELDREQVPFDHHIAIGMMVEVPAVVVMLDRFVPHVDFLSIGTNDLIQYALAVDRSNPDVASLYDAADPSILRLIDMTVRAGEVGGVSVSLCGQMTSNPMFAMLLVGLGLRQLSVPPSAIPEIKQLVRQCSAERCRAVAQRALKMDCPLDIRSLLAEEMRHVAPDIQVHASQW